MVPEPPSALKAKALFDSISISWKPPKDNRILLRGYKIGWGKGIPDEVMQMVSAKDREFIISGLKPSSEYVISLKAYNGVGDGRPVYETIRTTTKAEDDARFDEDLTRSVSLYSARRI